MLQVQVLQPERALKGDLCVSSWAEFTSDNSDSGTVDVARMIGLQALPHKQVEYLR